MIDPQLIVLRCQTVVEGQLVWVQVPMTWSLWEDDERAREAGRTAARTELWHLVATKTGRQVPPGAFTHTPVWAEYPDRCVVECVGGALDGHRVTIGAASPPPGVRMLAPEPPLGVLLAGGRPAEPAPMLTLLYVPLTDAYGFACRAADGTWRYRCTTP